MKTAATIIMLIGVMFVGFSNYSLNLDTMKATDEHGLSRYENHILFLPPWLGGVIISIGGGIYFLGTRKKFKG